MFALLIVSHCNQTSYFSPDSSQIALGTVQMQLTTSAGRDIVTFGFWPLRLVERDWPRGRSEPNYEVADPPG